MILLLDIGNTHTHLGLGDEARVRSQRQTKTAGWQSSAALGAAQKFIGRRKIDAVALCSVVPKATRLATRQLRELTSREVIELTPGTLRGVGIDYPKPNTIRPDRLANAVAVR